MARAKARTREDLEKMRKKEAQRKALLEATASANKKDSVTSLDATRVAVAQSSKCSEAVQAKRCAQKRSRSIVESDDESVEVMESFEDEKDSKPTTTTAFDVAVDYGDDNFFLNY